MKSTNIESEVKVRVESIDKQIQRQDERAFKVKTGFFHPHVTVYWNVLFDYYCKEIR